METGAVTVSIDAKMLFSRNSVHPLTHNTVCINLLREFKRFVVDQSDRTITCTGFSPAPPLPVSRICLNLFSYEFNPNYLFPLLDSHLHDPPLSLHIAGRISDLAIQNVGFLQSYLMSVNVVLTQDVFFAIPCSSLQETETQKVEDENEEASTCAICLEDLRNEDETIKLPQCSHKFHIDCIGEWLTRRNSCPLCREIVFEES